MRCALLRELHRQLHYVVLHTLSIVLEEIIVRNEILFSGFFAENAARTISGSGISLSIALRSAFEYAETRSHGPQSYN